MGLRKALLSLVAPIALTVVGGMYLSDRAFFKELELLSTQENTQQRNSISKDGKMFQYSRREKDPDGHGIE